MSSIFSLLFCCFLSLNAQNNYQQLNQLALNAQMHYDLNLAKQYYQQVIQLETDSSQLYIKEKLQALKGLRDIAMLEQEFTDALKHHEKYSEFLESNRPYLAAQQKIDNDKIQAICLQELGDSQAALNLLKTYAFGDNGYLDKEIVDHLASLLLTKYPKKALRKMLPNVQNRIRMEDGKEGIRFYLAFFDDKIYFPDGQRFAARLKAGQAIPEQAIAYYQRKLCNSYFYQKLMQEL